MKAFLTLMWTGGRITEEKLRQYCPIFITEAELSEILENGGTAA